ILTGGLASYRPYACADGTWLAVAPIEPKFFAQLCTALDRLDLVDLQYELGRQEELRDELAGVLATRTAAAWEQLLPDACACRVLHPREVASHPQLAARGAVRTLDGGERVPASPYVVDGVRSDSNA